MGSLADLTCFSLHPVKNITSGEGGAVVTSDELLARRLRMLRNHGVTADRREREEAGAWFYEMVELGFNYRLSDVGCALALSQLAKLPAFIARRQEVAARYDAALATARAGGTSPLAGVTPLAERAGTTNAHHLYVVRVPERDRVFRELRATGVGANVHYIPVHLHPFYRERLGTAPGDCPIAEAAYREIVSLPVFPQMTDDDARFVLDALEGAVGRVLADGSACEAAAA